MMSKIEREFPQLKRFEFMKLLETSEPNDFAIMTEAH